jgi:threonine dehydratase
MERGGIVKTGESGSSSAKVTLSTIREARTRIGAAILRSPCTYSPALSQLCGCDIFCKLDQLQRTGSFKERGARNRLLLLSDAQRAAGVIAASAGNHALALAYHGRGLGIPVTVVMPKTAPLVKVSNCQALGAKVILHGQSFDEAKQKAFEIVQQRQLVYVPGFDDPAVIAGAGTIGLELLEDVPDLDAVIVPIGGGGLIAGVGTAIKALRPQVRVIGVEPEHAASMNASIKQGKPVKISMLPTLADGLAVAEVGSLCLEITRNVMDQLVLVDEAQIARAVLRMLELEKTVVEGAGAVPLAAVMRRSLGLDGKKVALLIGGGNIDVSLISRIIERGLAADGRLCRLVALISDRPGGLAALTAVLAATGASIKEVWHDRNFAPADVAEVNISCVLETRDAAHISEVHEALRAAGIRFHVPRDY